MPGCATWSPAFCAIPRSSGRSSTACLPARARFPRAHAAPSSGCSPSPVSTTALSIASRAWEAWDASVMSPSPIAAAPASRAKPRRWLHRLAFGRPAARCPQRIQYQEALDHRFARSIHSCVWGALDRAPSCAGLLARRTCLPCPRSATKRSLLRAMGFETANVHLGTRARRQNDSAAILASALPTGCMKPPPPW